MSRMLDLLRDDLELEGFIPDTPQFERVFLARKVQRCQEMQHVKDCPSCRAFIDCDLSRKHMMITKFGGQ